MTEHDEVIIAPPEQQTIDWAAIYSHEELTMSPVFVERMHETEDAVQRLMELLHVQD